MAAAPIRGAVARAKASRPQPAYKLRRRERERVAVVSHWLGAAFEAVSRYHAFAPLDFPGIDIDAVHAVH